LRPGAIARAVIHTRRSVHERGLPTWPIWETGGSAHDCAVACFSGLMVSLLGVAPNALDLNPVLIAAGTKLHRAGWEAGSAFVFLHRACV